MTSSLVGSEMCIRDSISTILTQILAISTIASAMDNSGNSTQQQPQDEHCLLYTSDAADDM
eukprot:4826419-Prorocentrum_lima.AAC.1